MRILNCRLVVAMVFALWSATNYAQNRIKFECQKAYANGYWIGHESKICQVGHKNITEWVGVGNEEYTKSQENLTQRKGKYWWAE